MLEQVEDSGSASVVSPLEVWSGHRSERIIGAQGRGLTRFWRGTAGPLRTRLPHSPQLVWVDVNPCRQPAAACDKAQEATPVLWMKRKSVSTLPA